MIYNDGSEVMVDGVLLPGLFKSLEVTTAAEVEEQEVEGSTAQPKQATGYEDGKVVIELILQDSPGFEKEDKLRVIQNLFRAGGQEIPEVHTLINPHTAIRGISQVLFKNLTTKESNSLEAITASIEFWEYIPMTVSVTMSGGTGKTSYAGDKSGTATSGLNADYQTYLSGRGQAPKIQSKTSRTPAQE